MSTPDVTTGNFDVSLECYVSYDTTETCLKVVHAHGGNLRSSYPDYYLGCDVTNNKNPNTCIIS
eukprot:6143489-Amphidinium_carterae.1